MQQRDCFLYEKGKEFQRTGAQRLKELEKCLMDLGTVRSKGGV